MNSQREKFEAWAADESGGNWELDDDDLKRGPDGGYLHRGLQNEWRVWQAAISQQESEKPVALDRETMWKIHGALKDAGKVSLARVVADAATRPASQDQPATVELPELPPHFEIEWPQLHSVALGCGVEDRNIHDRYEAAEYGWQDGVDKAAECVPNEIYTADQMREYGQACANAALKTK